MKYYRKEMSDINEEDIKLLISMPQLLHTINGKNFMFTYGPYGFYGKYDDQNIKMPLRTIMNVLKGTHTLDEIKGCIDFHNKKKDSPASQASKKSNINSMLLVKKQVEKKVVKKFGV